MEKLIRREVAAKDQVTQNINRFKWGNWIRRWAHYSFQKWNLVSRSWYADKGNGLSKMNSFPNWNWHNWELEAIFYI